MQQSDTLFITPNFNHAQSLQWHAKYSSGSDINNSGRISKYAVTPTPHTNLILIPGLASNCKTEPLMQTFLNWGLLHNYNVYCIDTFLGNFQPHLMQKYAERNTVSELISLVDRGLTMIDERNNGLPTRIVAHSAGAISTIYTINRQIAQGRPVTISHLALFAPFVSDNRFNKIKHMFQGTKSDAEFYRTAIPIANPFGGHNIARYISLLPKFFEDLKNLHIDTNIVAQYDFPVTIVAGGRDNKVPPAVVYNLYKQFVALPNGNMFKYALFPRSNHSFIFPPQSWFEMMTKIRPNILPTLQR